MPPGYIPGYYIKLGKTTYINDEQGNLKDTPGREYDPTPPGSCETGGDPTDEELGQVWCELFAAGKIGVDSPFRGIESAYEGKGAKPFSMKIKTLIRITRDWERRKTCDSFKDSRAREWRRAISPFSRQ